MKICPNCQHENREDALFCENCGYQFSQEKNDKPKSRVEKQERVSLNQPPKKAPNKVPFIIAGLVVVAIIAGISLALLSQGGPDETANQPTLSTTSSADLTKYDDIIAEAKALTIEGEYKKSNRKLATIPASDLGKEEYSAIKTEVDNLTEENDEGIAETKDSQETKESQKAQVEQATPPNTSSATSGFTGDYGKWANNYVFYYNQEDQQQSTLKINSNGSVTQNNGDGTQFFGTATITGSSSGSILSYDTTEQYPYTMPSTKNINPNVQIKVQWDGGTTQIYYGYLSYSSRLALTDGSAKDGGVNEVWISY